MPPCINHSSWDPINCSLFFFKKKKKILRSTRDKSIWQYLQSMHEVPELSSGRRHQLCSECRGWDIVVSMNKARTSFCNPFSFPYQQSFLWNKYQQSSELELLVVHLFATVSSKVWRRACLGSHTTTYYHFGAWKKEILPIRNILPNWICEKQSILTTKGLFVKVYAYVKNNFFRLILTK